MDGITLKVGELAARTGLSVRTLHHYDQIGLLTPGLRSASGHRLYGRADLERLQRILSLRHLGFSLEEIAGLLDAEDTSALAVVELHRNALKERLERERALLARLEALAAAMREGGSISVEQLLTTIEAMQMSEQYYTPEQLQTLQARRATLGEEHIRQVEAEWPRLIAQVRAEMEKGTDPADPAVQVLALRWRELVAEFTGGDPGITASLTQMYREEGSEQASQGAFDRAVMEYIGRAMGQPG
jgi:DNA-binding transcriptional MerR regulator